MRLALALLPLLLPACGGASAPPVTVAELLPAGVQEVDQAVLQVLEQRVDGVNRDLGSSVARRSLALALEANAFWAEAIAQYRLVLDMDAADQDALLQLSGCLRQAGDLTGELEALERVVAARPDDRAALNRLAVARLDQGDLDRARDLFRTLKSLLPEHPHGPLGLGQVELEAGNASLALQHLESARALGRGAPFIDFVLGQCLAELGRTEEAVVLLDRGADSNRPQIATALEDEKARYSVSRADRISRAGRLHEAGRSAEARQILEQLREQDPDDVPVLNNLAAAQMKLGLQDEAIATLEHVLELEPDQYAAWFNLASIHFDRGQEQMNASGTVDADLVALAMSAADRAVEFGGHLANMHLMRAKVLMLARSYAEAVTEFQASIRLGTTNEDVYLNCSKVQMNLGDTAGGVQTLMDGAARNPGWAEVRIQLLPYWVARRDGLAARGVLKEIEELIPEDPRLAKLRDFLTANGL